MTTTSTSRAHSPQSATTVLTLAEEQQRTLRTPRRRYSLAARGLFLVMDGVYGRSASLGKFKVLEIIARVPYQAWENVAYVALTHRYRRAHMARRIFDRVEESRRQQDNEQWHLLIIEELIEQRRFRLGMLRFQIMPQLLAFAYYQLSWMLYVLQPRWSYRLNADFEDHAEHEYAQFVAENTWLDDDPYDGLFAEKYGRFDTLSDLFRAIALDERHHKQESVARMDTARFS